VTGLLDFLGRFALTEPTFPIEITDFTPEGACRPYHIRTTRPPHLPLGIEGASVMIVRRPGKVLLLSVLAAAMAVRATYAAPRAAIASIKATDCCARHCDHRAHPVRPDDCCQVLSQATDAAVVTATPSVHQGLEFFSVAPQTFGAQLTSRSLPARAPDFVRGGPPLFLANLSLRL